MVFGGTLLLPPFFFLFYSLSLEEIAVLLVLHFFIAFLLGVVTSRSSYRYKVVFIFPPLLWTYYSASALGELVIGAGSTIFLLLLAGLFFRGKEK